MQAGKLDRRIQFLRAELVDDGYQTNLGDYVNHGNPVWASKQEIRDGERWNAGGIGLDVVFRFTVRWSPFTEGITPEDRVQFEGDVFGIVGVKELGRKDWLEVTAARI